MKKGLIISGVALTAIAAPLIAFAATDKDMKKKFHLMSERFFEMHDENADGKISKEEMLSGRSEIFEKLDANKDGELTKDEADKIRDVMREHKMAKMLEKFDSDKDGFVSADEFSNHAMKKFEKADANNDGKLSTEELSSMRKHRKHHRKFFKFREG